MMKMLSCGSVFCPDEARCVNKVFFLLIFLSSVRCFQRNSSDLWKGGRVISSLVFPVTDERNGSVSRVNDDVRSADFLNYVS